MLLMFLAIHSPFRLWAVFWTPAAQYDASSKSCSPAIGLPGLSGFEKNGSAGSRNVPTWALGAGSHTLGKI